MTWLAIVTALVIGALLVDHGLTKLYQNQKQPHQTTPAVWNIAFREIHFPTKNACQLYGWWIPSQNDRTEPASTLIRVHGWGRNVERMLPYIQNLHPKGYNLLAFDARNHGSSDSDRFSSLLKFAEDIRAALDFVEKQENVDASRIGVLGLSVGGAAAIYAAAHDRRLNSVVTVGAFAHPADVMRLEFGRRHLPYFPLVWLMFKYIQFKIGATFEQIAPVNNIPKTRAKILLVHGDQDAVVPVAQAEKLEEAGNPGRIVLWRMEDKGHSDCHLHPEFWQKVDSFLRGTWDNEQVATQI
ncbi:MAG: alpha/beta hydrolase [bacterium]